jgi:hypothetical protein
VERVRLPDYCKWLRGFHSFSEKGRGSAILALLEAMVVMASRNSRFLHCADPFASLRGRLRSE